MDTNTIWLVPATILAMWALRLGIQQHLRIGDYDDFPRSSKVGVFLFEMTLWFIALLFVTLAA